MERADIPGWGIDREREARPGVPLEQRSPREGAALLMQPPTTQTIPLKGLSGLLRRVAYRWPDWKPRRWMLLMFADRVDVVESTVFARPVLIAGGALVALASLLLWARRRR